MEVTISSLVDQWAAYTVPRPTLDALREEDALTDAQLVAIWLSVSTSTAALLFDLRQADIGDGGNTAVLVVRGVQSVSWEGKPWNPGWLAWVTGTSIPSWIGETFTLELGFEHPSPGGGWPRCRIASNGARYYIGDVPGLPAAPPDFGTDSEETIREGMVASGSPFVPRYMSTIP